MIDIDTVNWDSFQLAKSGKTWKLLYNKEPVQFCTSTLYSPFGIKSVTKEWSTFSEYSLDCSLNQSNNVNATAFREFLEKLDEKVKELVEEAMQGATYHKILRENGNYPKLMKLQLNRDKNGNFHTVFFDENKEKLRVNEGNIDDLLPRGKTFRCIIECSKIWSYNDKVGSIWNIVQLKFADFKPKENNISYDTLMIQD
jgi:hypothetical protein